MAHNFWALFSIILHAYAQTTSHNLTVSFSPSNLEQCAANGSAGAITFATSSIPLTYECFNLEDLFNSTGTLEFGGRTGQSVGSSSSELITWRLHNWEAYNPRTNYSQIWYKQLNVTSPSEGQDAARIFQAFSDRNCVQSGPTNESLYPIIGWTCQSSEGGDCFRLSYNIVSFRVGSAWDVNSQDGKCWTASTGVATGLHDQIPLLTLVSLLTVALCVSLS